VDLSVAAIEGFGVFYVFLLPGEKNLTKLVIWDILINELKGESFPARKRLAGFLYKTAFQKQ